MRLHDYSEVRALQLANPTTPSCCLAFKNLSRLGPASRIFSPRATLLSFNNSRFRMGKFHRMRALLWLALALFQSGGGNAIRFGRDTMLAKGFRGGSSSEQKPKRLFRIPSAVGDIGRASMQLAVHTVCRPRSLSFGKMSNPRVACLSGITAYMAAKYLISHSEASHRALYFWKRAGPIVAHYKWTQFWLKATRAPLEHRHVVWKSLHDRYSEPSYELILGLKGLYVKIGQVMSSRSDFLPYQYTDIFATLQDSIPQWPVDEAIEVVSEALRERELDFEDVFESIDSVSIGCASIGQVHRAHLQEKWLENWGGDKVVAVKIMHPSAKERFRCDFQVFHWLCRVAMPGWAPLLEELERRLMTEFDYRDEAKNQEAIRSALQKSSYSKRVKIPMTYEQLTFKHVLVMEMLDGKKLIDSIEQKLSQIFGGDREKAAAILAERQREAISGEASDSTKTNFIELFNVHGFAGAYRALKALALYRKVQSYIDLLIDVHGYQIFEAGSFSADPHPGNIMELPDGRLGLIDFGQTKYLKDEERLAFAQIIVDLGTKATHNQVANSMRRAGFRTRDDDDETLSIYAGLFFDSDHVSKEKGYSTPQHYFQDLMEMNPLVDIPDSAIMVARASVLFRGAGAALHYQVQTAHNWMKHANKALHDAKL